MMERGASPDTNTSLTRMRRRWVLRLARWVWLTLFAVNFLVITVNHILVTSSILRPCQEVSCVVMQGHLVVVSRFVEVGVPPIIAVYYRPTLDFVAWVIYLVLSILIFRRSSHDWMSLLVSAALFLVGPRLSGSSISISQLVPSMKWVGFSMLSLMFCVSLAGLYLYPTGRFVPRWTWGVLALHIIISVSAAYIQSIEGRLAPFSLVLVNVGLTLVGVGFLVYRYRFFSTPTQRQQTKLVIAAVVMMALGQLLRESVMRFGPNLQGEWFVLVMMGGHISAYVFGLALPVAIASAVLRYRLWDADFVINRSVMYSVVALVMAIVFAIFLFVFKVILRLLSGVDDSTGSLIVATAVMVSAYNPVRRRVSQWLDVHVYGFRMDLDAMRQGRRGYETVMFSSVERADGARTGAVARELRLEQVLGRGGMGEVYLGRHLQTGQAFAVKFLPRELAHYAEAVTRFQREVQILGSMNHPNIIKTYGAGQTHHTLYYVMDYVDGQTLGDLLKRRGTLSLSEALVILKGIAAGLDAAHAAGIVHRDIKPSNILLRLSDGQPVLTDFGIAKLTDEAAPALTRSTMMGTLEYVAPEQIITAREVDHRADIYALGVVAYQMMTGRTPFRGGVGRLVFSHLNQPVPDPLLSQPDIPSGVVAALLKALSKHPDERYESAGAFYQALNDGQRTFEVMQHGVI